LTLKPALTNYFRWMPGWWSSFRRSAPTYGKR